MKRHAYIGVVILISLTDVAHADNWSAWRGAAGDGVAQETNLPVEFGSEKNVTWKTLLPGEGNSVPIIWDDRVFVTCPIDGGAIRSLICFERNTGEQLWRHDVPFPEKETTHSDNPFCSGSPTTDGERVYASFDSAGIFALDFEGNVIWQRDFGKLAHVFGTAITPVLYHNLLIIHRGPGEPTHIVGLDKKTGETVWDTPEEGKNHNLWGSWSTPVIYRAGDHDEFALSMPNVLKGYDPNTGKELWRCDGLEPVIDLSQEIC
ncbi:MAG: PQQ-binding-like beta-propeller repeat protein [Planctomycetota bacterium]|nr:PQQ-binding-like beta-propeller repeat protein [Planctomycetota bacterium]MDA1211960.1 PQQ-binding-like beta-propeller repeat protein [Planctomycetota bacterium]